MNFLKYEEIVIGSMVYPNQGNNLAYPVLGLVEETGEIVEKIDFLDKQGLKKEMGDVIWYMTAFCYELNCNFDKFESDMKYIPQLKTQAILQNVGDIISKIASIVKKTMRDSGGVITVDNKGKLEILIQQIINLFNTLSLNQKFTIYDVLELNANKIIDRKNRNVVHGSGDDR